MYNVWNNGYALRSANGHWASAVDFDTKEQAQAWMQQACIKRQDRLNLPAHLRMNYEVKEKLFE